MRSIVILPLDEIENKVPDGHEDLAERIDYQSLTLDFESD